MPALGLEARGAAAARDVVEAMRELARAPSPSSPPAGDDNAAAPVVGEADDADDDAMKRRAHLLCGAAFKASAMRCFYMPAQWAVPYLQWAAGEKCAISEVKLSKRVASPPEVGMNRERERYRSIAILLS